SAWAGSCPGGYASPRILVCQVSSARASASVSAPRVRARWWFRRLLGLGRGYRWNTPFEHIRNLRLEILPDKPARAGGQITKKGLQPLPSAPRAMDLGKSGL